LDFTVSSSAEIGLVVGQEIEVTAKARRRQFTAEYKRKVLAEAEACTKPGEIGALLRREGLYSSHLVEWRRARDSGALAGLAPRKRGPAAKVPHPLERKVAELEREVARATRRAERAEGLVELQKKVSELLGIQLPKPDEEK
jgi:transposase